MDTLRLLSRSSGIKLGRVTQTHASNQVPSAGSDHQQNSANHSSQTGKKRKREADLQDVMSAVNSPIQQLEEVDIRKIQKQHKIKITDLHALRSVNRSENRKAQKEGSRLFPQPLQSFAQLRNSSVNKALQANIAEQAFKEPTEVQLATIPLLLRNDQEQAEPDLLTVAPTGSGKTLAFFVPLIDKISRAHRDTDDYHKHVSAIILAPTKELVGQIVNEGRKLTANTGVSISEMRKGMKLHEDQHEKDVENLEEEKSVDDDDDDGSNFSSEDDTRTSTGTLVKSDIIVATPLSLANAITSARTKEVRSLPGILNLVLDEADVLLDALFRDQTLSIWSACHSPDLSVSLWSATIGASIEELAISTIHEHHLQHRRHQNQKPLLRTIIGLKDTSLPSITHRLVYASTEPGKLMGLRQLLHPAPSTTTPKNSLSRNQISNFTQSKSETPLRPPFIIFTQTITRAQDLYKELQYDIPPAAGGSSRIAVLHSSLSSKQRSNTMTSFRQGKIWILITTDLLSRGVDFRGVNGVVNYDIPTTAASYVHRAGRTGRAGRKGGIVVTFYTREDVKYLKPIANIITASTKNDVNVDNNNNNNSTSSSSTIESSTNDTKTTQKEESPNGVPDWLIPSLPYLTKTTRKDLKQRGVQERRAIKKSDDDTQRRHKLKNRIGTTSGYERKLMDRKRDMIQGSKRRVRRDRDRDHDQHQDGDGHGGGRSSNAGNASKKIRSKGNNGGDVEEFGGFDD